MKTKVTVNVEKGVLFDFELSDEITGFNVPYIYFMHQSFLKIVSPLTNRIVRTFDFSLKLLNAENKLISKTVSQKELKTGVFNLFNKLTLSHYMECYLSSPKMDCMCFLKLIDNNTTEFVYSIVDQEEKIHDLWAPIEEEVEKNEVLIQDQDEDF